MKPSPNPSFRRHLILRGPRRIVGHVFADSGRIPVQRSQAAFMPRNVPAVIQRPDTDRGRLQARRAAVVIKFGKDRFMCHAHSLLCNYPTSSMGKYTFAVGLSSK